MTNDNGIGLQTIHHWPAVHSPALDAWHTAARQQDTNVLDEILRRVSGGARAHEQAEQARLRMFGLAAGAIENQDDGHHHGGRCPGSPVPRPRTSSGAPPGISP